MALVSLVLPAFNVAPWIDRCLESVLNQTHTDLEVLILDDGSSDGTYERARRYCATDSRVKISRWENRGQSAARNQLFSDATGDIVMCVDTDDWLAKDAVEKVVDAFHAHRPDMVMFRCAKYLEAEDEWRTGSDDFYWQCVIKQANVGTVSLSEVPAYLALYPLPQLKAINRKFMVKHNLRFIEGVKYEDNPLHMRLFSLSTAVHFLPDTLYAWRQDRVGQTTSRPWKSDAETVVRACLSELEFSATEARCYGLLAVLRLVAKVATQIQTVPARDLFLDHMRSVMGAGWSPELRQETEKYLFRYVRKFHPADIVLAALFHQSPSSLSRALDTDVSVVSRATLAIKAISTVQAGSTRRVVFQHVLGNVAKLLNFSRGEGEGTAQQVH